MPPKDWKGKYKKKTINNTLEIESKELGTVDIKKDKKEDEKPTYICGICKANNVRTVMAGKFSFCPVCGKPQLWG